MVGAIFQAALPLSGGQASCRARSSRLLGSRQCQRRPGVTSESPWVSGVAVDSDWWVFPSWGLSGQSGRSSRSRGVPGDVWGGASAAMWCPPGSSCGPSWSGVTPVNPGRCRGDSGFYRDGGTVNDGGSRPQCIFKPMGRVAQG